MLMRAVDGPGQHWGHGGGDGRTAPQALFDSLQVRPLSDFRFGMSVKALTITVLITGFRMCTRRQSVLACVPWGFITAKFPLIGAFIYRRIIFGWFVQVCQWTGGAPWRFRNGGP